jgi:hypothetical protein
LWTCKICSGEWEAIPDHAVLLNKRGVTHVYRFSDNTVHILYRARPISADHRWHRNLVFDCEFCFPPPPEPQPEVVEEVKPEVVAEIEGEVEVPTTAMAAAFSRIKS